MHSHLWSADVLLRRWSMKALGLIAHRDDTPRLLDRLRIEDDFEAQTWGTAALIATAGDRSMAELCADAGVERSTPFWLAARLYAPHHWINHHWQPTTVSLTDDEITLKWAIFLAGYDKAPEDMFSPRYDNRIFLGELNQHESPMLAEYSVWALWERPDLGFPDLRIAPDQFLKKPENARKWLYRLLLQSPNLGGQDLAIIEEYRTKEKSASAREGLAAGLAERMAPPLHNIALDWYDDESDASVQDILLSSMAAKSDENSDFTEVVRHRFVEAGAKGHLRKRLLAAAEGTNLYGH
ncbi:hypothetical protein MCBMB27_05619 [Methylobacterium phyllosphaerae]|uniref:Uncharacterized protein n=2 Tax=Methylobacterium phyllosphaerae TaxID=418223 RepID=A0AAE8L8B4_9HYPH|nr:hypothetical protein MCBMB27_05619 [Methylobacterium phyllosphaerae]SFH36428.1 hypothetical protein SAMN05192567_121120 [Methylobacterium phyllosphaerae]